MFRFFFTGNPLRQATRGLAIGSLFTGLFLIGFGMLVFILRDIFAFLAALVFFMMGISAIGYGIRLYWGLVRAKKADDRYRRNVQVRIEDDSHSC